MYWKLPAISTFKWRVLNYEYEYEYKYESVLAKLRIQDEKNKLKKGIRVFATQYNVELADLADNLQLKIIDLLELRKTVFTMFWGIFPFWRDFFF